MNPFRILFLLSACSFLLFSQSYAQSTELRGRITDATTKEPLIGVRVELRKLHRGAITDAKGAFTIHDLPIDTVEVEVHLLGYSTFKRSVILTAGQTTVLDVGLSTQTLSSQEVTVQGDRQRETERTSVSRIELNPTVIEQVPAIGGESDLFRVLQLLPGIKSLSEVSSGLYIRGGPPDQNLILLDNNVVYNPSHLFGFFSTFNTDAIKNVDLSKGGYPAEYGGRLTGVLNVTTREGDNTGIHGKTSVSFISARQTLEFPLLSGSVLVSARRTYIDAFLNLINANKLFNAQLPQYYFYDLNAKIDQDLSANDKLSISGYYGADNLHYPTNGLIEINLNWGNRVAGAKWTHIYSDNVFSEVFAGYTQYNSHSFGSFTSSPYDFNNGVQEATAKVDIDWKLNPAHDVRIGTGVSRFNFSLFNSIGSTNTPLKDTAGVPYYLSLYAQDVWKASDRVTATYGLRGEWLDQAKAITLDPRLTVSYQFDPLWTLKASTGIYHQFLHLVSMGEFSFFDLWVPGTSPLPPSRSTQYILGISGYPDDKYFASCEAYYKRLSNIVEYNETKFLSHSITDIFPLGTGEAYGVELFLQKRIGDLSGWIGYTLSWVREKFDAFNNGIAFSPKYDQRHDVQLVLHYKLSDRWDVGGTWTYATGQAYTSTLGYYNLAFDEVGFSSTLNIPGSTGEQRLPGYHRADASLNYSFTLFGKEAKASLDIFNIYSHRNVWFRVVDTEKRPPEVSDVLLLPIIPTLGIEVTY